LLRDIHTGEITAVEADCDMEFLKTPEVIACWDRLKVRHEVMGVRGIRTVTEHTGLLRIGIADGQERRCEFDLFCADKGIKVGRLKESAAGPFVGNLGA
jgi:hypothetical protein